MNGGMFIYSSRLNCSFILSRKSHIEPLQFQASTRIDTLMVEVEDLYTHTLESGDRRRAMQRLRVPPLDEKQSHLVTFRVGIFVGEYH